MDQYLIEAATLRKSYKIGKRRNIAIADCYIAGDTKKFIAVSGKHHYPETVEMPLERRFRTFPYPSNVERDYDSEYKILEKLYSLYQDNPSVAGQITLFTEREPCPSCQSVITQFRECFPNIVVNLLTSS